LKNVVALETKWSNFYILLIKSIKY